VSNQIGPFKPQGLPQKLGNLKPGLPLHSILLAQREIVFSHQKEKKTYNGIVTLKTFPKVSKTYCQS
jgi:hypothetical protein